ncbi:MAG: nitroreductase family protein [Bacteroidales bacterium]
MQFSDLVMHRESVRRYSTRGVEPQKIERIMESCRLAPSACNSQPWKLVVVTDPSLQEKVANATFNSVLQFNRFVIQAPVIVAVIAEPPNWLSRIGGTIKDKPYYLMDIGIVADHFCMQAAELGLGTCMIGWFDEKKVKSLLHVPAKKRIPLLITLGYPEKDTTRKKIRKSSQEFFSYNTY